MNKQPRKGGYRKDVALALRRMRKLLRGKRYIEDDATRIAHLLADIRNYCHTAGIDYYEASDRAYGYYRDERNLPTFNPEREAA